MSDSQPAANSTVRFGVFELDTGAGELRKHGLRINLQEQPFQVLRILLEKPGQVVTREELQQRLWTSDTFVEFDKGIYNAIKRLRETLGDDAEIPRYIETIPRRGYRFIAPVTVNGNAGAIEGLRTNHGFARNVRTAIIVCFGAAVLFVALLRFIPSKSLGHRSVPDPAPEIRSLAVLPLQNLSADPTQQYFSDGMTDALITDLAQIGSLKVISRTSSMQYRHTKKSLPEIARELNVDGIVEGTVQRSGDRVRITAQLIYGASDKHLWAASYERDLSDVLGLERDIAGDVARQVQARLTAPSLAVPGPSPRTVSLRALEAYFQGENHLQKAMIAARDTELRTAGQFFQRAIDVQPDFAPAYIGLAEAHHNLWWPSSNDFTIMRGAAEKAVALAPASSEALAKLALVKWEDWDWSGAEKEYRKAIALNPNNASAHDRLGYCLEVMGRLAEGGKEQEIAQALDPGQDHLSGLLYLRGDYDRAIELLRKWLEAHPEDGSATYFLAQDYLEKGMHKQWIEELARSFTLFGFPELARRLQDAFVVSGREGATRQWADEVERLAANRQGYFPGVLAQAYALIGDRDRAFYWLRQGIAHHHLASSDPALQWLKVDPELASLRSDPRYKEMLRRMGLPE